MQRQRDGSRPAVSAAEVAGSAVRLTRRDAVAEEPTEDGANHDEGGVLREASVPAMVAVGAGSPGAVIGGWWPLPLSRVPKLTVRPCRHSSDSGR